MIAQERGERAHAKHPLFPFSRTHRSPSQHPWSDEYDARLVALCHEADGIARLEIELTPLARHRAGARR